MEKGLTEQKIARLDKPRFESGDFTAREEMAIEYAQMLATNHNAIDEVFFERLRLEFNDAEILELGMMIGQYIGFGRLLKILDLEPKFCET